MALLSDDEVDHLLEGYEAADEGSWMVGVDSGEDVRGRECGVGSWGEERHLRPHAGSSVVLDADVSCSRMVVGDDHGCGRGASSSSHGWMGAGEMSMMRNRDESRRKRNDEGVAPSQEVLGVDEDEEFTLPLSANDAGEAEAAVGAEVGASESGSGRVRLRMKTKQADRECRMEESSGRQKYKDKDVFHEVLRKAMCAKLRARRSAIADAPVREVRKLATSQLQRLSAARKLQMVKEYMEGHPADVTAEKEVIVQRVIRSLEQSDKRVVEKGKQLLPKSVSDAAFLRGYWALLTWNAPGWVWKKHVLGIDQCDLEKAVLQLRMHNVIMKLWLGIQESLEAHRSRIGVDRWTLSLEVSPETWEAGQIRLHLHGSLQAMNHVLHVRSSEELVVCGAQPFLSRMASAEHGDQSAYAVNAGASHFYCSVLKKGQVGELSIV